MPVPSLRVCCTVLLFLSVAIPGIAQAQGVISLPLNQAGSWEFGVWTGEAGGEVKTTSGPALITMTGFHVGRVLAGPREGGRGTLEYTVNVMPLMLTIKPKTVYGGGFSPFGLKWNFAGSTRLQPYVELTGGGVITTQDVPLGKSSSFNFTASFGPGVVLYRSPRRAVSLALCYWHLSNAGTGHLNPTFNTVQFTLGYHWLKPR